MLDTNLFDVITSLGTGLYVHHIEFTSFPLCRLNRDLPAIGPGGEGERVVFQCGVEGNAHKKNEMKKIDQEWKHSKVEE